jgi:hypothetical protein
MIAQWFAHIGVHISEYADEGIVFIFVVTLFVVVAGNRG